ncbi:endonuclease/exonuclease/phosphatase family protein [Labedaea rhizosphaerae]|uniref:Endonuclease/exonuclease/phosphatase family metal-dependent hydrolase n=1 Tax=Labedaea rhizosphaerae TaxID=598644 RepID=A0A4R6SJJ5_LABRH|nr:endonuclease/exonuclease/phosphatase family protein [Labedaea rhizosphaerae]TDQ01109.1 endonuclease/exonuclease/phosphatase family metal-dependent hydrolase [Labedaea rhizosphaerae]
MRPRLLALATAFVVAGSVAAATPAAASGFPHVAPLRVMAYNIHSAIGEDGVLDVDRTAATIAAQHPDVVGLEEVDVNWATRSNYLDEARELAQRLHMHVFFAPIYDLPPDRPGAPNRQFGVAVLTRLPVLATENHPITRLSTQDPNPVPAPAPGFGEVVVNDRGVRVHVYVTHLDYRADPAVRAMQVADTLSILDSDPVGEPQILIGDFNAEPSAPELAPLLARMQDTAPAGAPTYPADVPTKKIDYVTAAGWFRVLGGSVPDTLASDHRPVVTQLLVGRG